MQILIRKQILIRNLENFLSKKLNKKKNTRFCEFSSKKNTKFFEFSSKKNTKFFEF